MAVRHSIAFALLAIGNPMSQAQAAVISFTDAFDFSGSTTSGLGMFTSSNALSLFDSSLGNLNSVVVRTGFESSRMSIQGSDVGSVDVNVGASFGYDFSVGTVAEAGVLTSGQFTLDEVCPPLPFSSSCTRSRISSFPGFGFAFGYTDAASLSSFNGTGTFDINQSLDFFYVSPGPRDLDLAVANISGIFEVVYDFTPVSVPEPGTLALLGLGLAGMSLSKRRKKA